MYQARLGQYPQETRAACQPPLLVISSCTSVAVQLRCQVCHRRCSCTPIRDLFQVGTALTVSHQRAKHAWAERKLVSEHRCHDTAELYRCRRCINSVRAG